MENLPQTRLENQNLMFGCERNLGKGIKKKDIVEGEDGIMC